MIDRFFLIDNRPTWTVDVGARPIARNRDRKGADTHGAVP